MPGLCLSGLSYKKILDQKSGLLKIDYSKKVNKVIQSIKEFQDEHNSNMEKLRLGKDLLINLNTIDFSQEVYEETLKDLSEYDFLKTA